MDLFGFPISESLVWIGIAVIFAIIEAFTLGLTTIWFTVGGVGAAIVAMAGAPLYVQVIVFLLVSCILLYFTKSLAEKRLKIGHEKSNLELMIGKTGIITSDITPYNTGLAKVGGQIWTVVTRDNGETIPAGQRVEVVEIEGVKLIVMRTEEV